MKFKIVAVVGVAACAMAMPANAGTVFSFDVIPDDESVPADAATGEAQIFVEVSAFSGTVDTVDPDGDGMGGGPLLSQNLLITGVQFRFFNIGPNASSITSIYFEDGAVLKLTAIADSNDNTGFWNNFGQVDYQFDALDVGNLPRGNTIGFTELAGFLAEPDSPGGFTPNGVGPGEEVSIIWTLQPGKSAGDVVDALLDGSLRIGIHVGDFDGGGSESFINNGTVIIPLPSVAGMGLLGLGGLMMTRRRRI